jgi:hypothetical protein
MTQTNRYATRCVKCSEDIEAGKGVLYKEWPFGADQKWKVRCSDETACQESQNANKPRRNPYMEERDRRLRDEALAKALGWCQRYPNLPNTVRLNIEDGGPKEYKMTRRQNKDGSVSVLFAYTANGVTERNTERFFTNEEAASRIVNWLLDSRFSDREWWNEAQKVLEAAKADTP